jgi:pectinesterase
MCREKVKVPKSKPFVTFLGEGADQTKITWHDTSASSNNSTFKSASVSVMANGFVARNLAFEVKGLFRESFGVSIV